MSTNISENHKETKSEHVNKEKRKSNAELIYYQLRYKSFDHHKGHHDKNKLAIVIDKQTTSTGKTRCRLLAKPDPTREPLVIADSYKGFEGAWEEMLKFFRPDITPMPAADIDVYERYYDHHLYESYGLRIDYMDDFVVILEKLK